MGRWKQEFMFVIVKRRGSLVEILNVFCLSLCLKSPVFGLVFKRNMPLLLHSSLRLEGSSCVLVEWLPTHLNANVFSSCCI